MPHQLRCGYPEESELYNGVRNIDEQLQQTNNEINSVVYAADNAMLCFIDRM